MGYRYYPPPAPLLVGYDPYRDLPRDHLARLVEAVVEMTLEVPTKPRAVGQPEYDPRLLVKVLIYGYATGTRASRQLERLCTESLPYLFLTRGEAPNYHTICTARRERTQELEQVWEALFAVAGAAGIKRVGRIALDSTKLWANASPEAVLTQDEFAPVLVELQRILQEAEEADARDDREGKTGETLLGQPVEHEVMRDILRRVRGRRKAQKQAAVQGSAGTPTDEPVSAEPVEGSAGAQLTPARSAEAGHTPQMMERIELACQAIEEAMTSGEKHVCLTDPDARMMYGGRVRSTRECHSLEVAAEEGVLLACTSTQEGNDASRLLPLVEEAGKHLPEGGKVESVDADSGYYRGDDVAALIERGVDVCIPDSNTASDLHRGLAIGTTRGKWSDQSGFTYDAALDAFRCAAAETLSFVQERQHGGQKLRVYRADADCQECALAPGCLKHEDAKHRTLKVGVHQELLSEHLARFTDPAFRERYRHRAEAVETVFGFLRATLGYFRWLLRGRERVACESRLFGLAYQFRKIHSALTSPRPRAVPA